MLRAFFIWLSKVKWAQRMIMGWKFARRAATRFVAGDTIEQAIQTARRLGERGMRVSLDHLGENTMNEGDAGHATEDILELLDEIQKSGVKANVSIKLSQIGLNLGDEICRGNLIRILERARGYGNFVRIDMEDSGVTDRTIEMLMYAYEHGISLTDVGIVVQAYLYRTEEDVRKLEEKGIRVRLCKGAYMEPASVAFPKKADVDANYDLLAKMLLEAAKKFGPQTGSADGRMPPIPGIATHDIKRIRYVQETAREIGLAKDCFEFQMLLGIRQDLQEQLVKDGYLVRIYVPYGTAWFPYNMRRLAERPANVWFFISNIFK